MDSSGADRIYFDTDALPERDRFPAVCEEFARQLLTIDAINRSTKTFSAKFDINRVGRLAVAYIDTSAADYVRTPQLIRDGQEFFFATLNFKGTMFCSQPDVSRPILPGEAALLDSTHVGGIHFDDDGSYLTMQIPRSEIASLLPNRVRLRRRQAGPRCSGAPIVVRLPQRNAQCRRRQWRSRRSAL